MAVPRVIYNGLPKNHSWARWMVARTLRKNSNNLVSFIGKVGSGKTWSGISIAQLMTKMSGVPFTINQIVFSLTELMTLINSGELKKGSCIIFDEPQISISSKDFQSQANKVFNMLVSTFRHRNFSLFFCTPFEALLDKSTRKLFTSRFEMLSINSKKKTCRIKPRFVEYSDYKPVPYVKQMIVCFKKDGMNKSEKLSYWDVPKPSEEIIEAYEKKKLEFTTNLNKNIMSRLETFDNSGKSMTSKYKPTEKKLLTEKKPLTERQEEVMKVLANLKKEDRNIQAQQILGISLNAIYNTRRFAEKKGYTMEDFIEK